MPEPRSKPTPEKAPKAPTKTRNAAADTEVSPEKSATAAKAPGTRKAAGTASPKRASAKKDMGGNGERAVTPEQRWKMIAEAAYYRAERRGFVGGDPAQDWVDAEMEIDQMLGRSH